MRAAGFILGRLEARQEPSYREAEACFEPVFCGVAGLRRIYPDLPGMGRTVAPDTVRSADDVLDTLLNRLSRAGLPFQPDASPTAVPGRAG